MRVLLVLQSDRKHVYSPSDILQWAVLNVWPPPHITADIRPNRLMARSPIPLAAISRHMTILAAVYTADRGYFRTEGGVWVGRTILKKYSCRTLLHTNPTLWCYTLMLHFDSTFWFWTLILHSDITLWFYTLILYSDIAHWFYTLILHSATTLWCCTLILHSNDTLWYCTLILHSDTTL